MRLANKEVSENNSAKTPNNSTPKSLITIGGSGGSGFSPRGRRNVFSNPTDLGVSLTTVQAKGGSARDWERLHDEEDEIPLSPCKDGVGSNQSGGIRADYTYTVELETMKRDDSPNV